MRFRQLDLLLWVLNVSALTAQGHLSVHVTRPVKAPCHEPVTLTCNVTSNQGGLLIKTLAWYYNGTTLCDWIRNGQQVTEQQRSNYKCSFVENVLTITFEQAQPNEIGAYTCEVVSNQGIEKQETRIDLKGCFRQVEGYYNPAGKPVCIFTGVYPGGEVHWYKGSIRLPESSWSTHSDTQPGGWFTITSTLVGKEHMEPYNCSLSHPKSKIYTASGLVQTHHVHTHIEGQTFVSKVGAPQNGTTGVEPLWTITFLFITAVLMKYGMC